MTGGFAFVAYPAEYRSSGVMTFIVGDDGVVYRKISARTTDALAKAMKEYNPDSTLEKGRGSARGDCWRATNQIGGHSEPLLRPESRYAPPSKSGHVAPDRSGIWQIY